MHQKRLKRSQKQSLYRKIIQHISSETKAKAHTKQQHKYKNKKQKKQKKTKTKKVKKPIENVESETRGKRRDSSIVWFTSFFLRSL
jgi:superoxide dismutase